MKPEHISEIKAIIILAIGVLVFASLVSFVPEDLSWYTSQPNFPAHNLIRVTGVYLAGVLFFIFGYSAYFLVAFLLFWACNKFILRDLAFTFSKLISVIVLFCVVSGILSMLGVQEGTHRFQRAGIVGLMISDFLVQYFGVIGACTILIMLGVMSIVLIGEFLITPVVMSFYENLKVWYLDWRKKLQSNIKKEKPLEEIDIKPKIHLNHGQVKNSVLDEGYEDDEGDQEEDEEYEEEDEDEEYEEEEKDPNIKIVPMDKKKKVKKGKKVVGEYIIPSLELLKDSPEIKVDNIQGDLLEGAKILEGSLAEFGVSARVVDIERGPAITCYELEPGSGVKVQKFTALADDIALAMKAAAVRIVAPIPGKNRVGIEIPNGSSAAVFLKDVLSSDEFQKSKSRLTISLGKDISGKAMVANLAEMPHLLIAGTTGSGKTVCVNGIIMSILLNASPDEVKFIMVDPKMVEMVQYQDIPHLLAPPVIDSKKAAAVLNWVVGEMENRYKTLSKVKVRNIQTYNGIKGKNMPYIVVIVDELADLMQVSAKSVEGAIARLAQLSRAVGIHLILATQRPSVNVITGVIKANLPARISFKVASKIDSRTVLDMNGAESLLGKGDLLFSQPGDAKPKRGQGSFVSDDEIKSVIDYIKRQRGPLYNDVILQQQKMGVDGSMGEEDSLYKEAVQLVVQTNQASVSMIQRRMRIGYTRSARLIDMMEQDGIVGEYCGSKARDILVDREQWLIDNIDN